MKAVNQKAAKVLNKLTANLEHPADGDSHRCVDNTRGTYMPVVVERIGDNVYSVAHYYEQNGDMCSDPEMTFLYKDGRWFPCSFAMSGMGIRREGLVLDENEAPYKIAPREQRDEATFAGQWMRNIKDQQGL